MKTAVLIARIVLGFVFLVFGYMVPQLSASDAGSTERSSGYGSDAIENSQQGTLSSRAP